MTLTRKTSLALRLVALAYLFALLMVPLAMIFLRTFEDGLSPDPPIG